MSVAPSKTTAETAAEYGLSRAEYDTIVLRLNRELGLTILFSSHLLNEVEQLCTRIAILQKGCKVFEGTISDALRSQRWVRLRVNAFEDAVRVLTEHKLIDSVREGSQVALTSGCETDALVRVLVEQGFSVFEIAPQEMTLEAFYLSLVQKNQKGSR